MEKQVVAPVGDPGTKTVISGAPMVKITQPRTQIEANNKLYASKVSLTCFFSVYAAL